MSHANLRLVRTIGCFGLLVNAATSACVNLTGIESGGGDDLLDYDVVSVSLEKEPFDLSNALISTIAECSSGLETPVSMRLLLSIDTAVFSIASMFHSNDVALDIFGDKDTSDARRRCQPTTPQETSLFDLHLRVAVMYAFVYGGTLGMPYCVDLVDPLMSDAGHPLSLMLEGDPSVETPWGLAKAYVDEVADFLTANDGWNADGSKSQDYNRTPFSDYSITDSAGNSWTPYSPTLSDDRWQPLIESDDLGFIFTQTHVTPHIGVTARFFGFRSAEDEEAFAIRELTAPRYRYSTAAQEVLDQSVDTAGDDYKQAAIDFFDNKFLSLVPLKIELFTRSSSTQLSTLDFYRATVEVQLAIYNGIVLSWREKVRSDLPRPTTVVITELGDTLVEAYAGEDEGVKIMKASEWEPFMRTMPHSEYPSASACVCQVYAEQMAAFLGTDEIDPALEFGPFEFSSWSEISEVCGDSRVWGGMHFPEAVPGGVELCGGNLLAESITTSIGDLIEGDESAAVFDKDIGELMLRPL